MGWMMRTRFFTWCSSSGSSPALAAARDWERLARALLKL
jgi:hypothetical protein